MGVNGLWQLLSPVARPVALETLEKRRLAIDASIWLYQFQMATRDRKTGDVIQGAHVMGTFRRIMKLLFHGIQPVFVFDGAAPALKRRTLEQRRKRKEGAGQSLARTAKALLFAQLRAHMAEQENKKQEVRNKSKKKAQATDDTGDVIDENVVYFDDLDQGNAAPRPRRVSTPPPQGAVTDTTSPAKKYVPKDQYALPAIKGPLEARAKATDVRFATEQETVDFFEDLRPDFFDSEEFASLSTQHKYEILGEQRLKSRQVNHQRVQQMKLLPTPLDFSQSQIQNLLERNQYTMKLLEVTDELSNAAIKIPTRIAGERGKVYELIKQDPSKGTGYVLGVRNPVLGSTAPITIDTTTDESAVETDSDEFEEVGVTPKKQASPAVDPEARRVAALEAIQARLGPRNPQPDFDPYLDAPAAAGSASLFRVEAHGAPAMDDSEDQELQAAMRESALLAKIAEAVQAQTAKTRSLSDMRYAEAGGSGLSTAEKMVAEQARDQGAESDDSLEYVDISTGPTSPQARPAPNPPISVPILNLAESDDDSDDFEEVAINASVPPSSRSPALPPTRARSASSHPPPPKPHPPPTTASAPARRSLMDSVLQSDDDSEEEMEVVQTGLRTESPARKHNGSSAYAAARRQAQPQPIARPSSPHPSDFELANTSSSDPPPVIARDFASSAEPMTLPLAGKTEAPLPAPSRAHAILVVGPGEMLPVELEAAPLKERTEDDADAEDNTKDSEDEMEIVEHFPPVPALQSARAPSPRQATESGHLPSAPPRPAERRSEFSPDTILGQAAEVASSATHYSLPSSPSLLDQLEDFLPPIELPPLPDLPLPDLPPLPLPPLPELPALPALTARSSPPSPPHARPTARLGSPFGEQGPSATAEAVDHEQLDDEEEFFEWEKSPTPPPRESAGQALFRAPEDDDFVGDEEEPDYEAEEEEEMIRNATREQEQYADMLSQLKNRKIEDMLTEARGDVTKLLAQKNAEKRNSDAITQTMSADIQEMLALFGIPFIIAPSEAEAECAELLSRKLVEGIVTDDSDVFLFGGSRIYRHMFNDNKVVECYLMSDLDRELGLDRNKLVQLAYLLGGDYTDGLPGVGPVQSRELLAEFDGDNGLQEFKDWWTKVQEGRDDHIDTNTPFKRKFKKGHKKLILEDNWPNPEIRKAYYKPVVTHSDEQLEWGSVDLDGLRIFMQKSLSWNFDKTSELMLPLIKRQQLRAQGKLKTQGFISDYFDVSAGAGPLTKRVGRAGYDNKRLQNVLKAHRRQRGESVESSKEEDEEVKDPSTDEEALPAPPKRPKTVSRKSSKTGSTSSSTKSTVTAKGKGRKRKKSPAADADDLPAPPRKKLGPKPMTAAERRKVDKARKAERAAARGGEYSSSEDLDAAPVERPPRKPRASVKRPQREVFTSSDEDGAEKRKRL